MHIETECFDIVQSKKNRNDIAKPTLKFCYLHYSTVSRMVNKENEIMQETGLTLFAPGSEGGVR